MLLLENFADHAYDAVHRRGFVTRFFQHIAHNRQRDLFRGSALLSSDDTRLWRHLNIIFATMLLRRTLYANTCTRGSSLKSASHGMWGVYGRTGESVAIETTVGAPREVLSPSTEDASWAKSRARHRTKTSCRSPSVGCHDISDWAVRKCHED